MSKIEKFVADAAVSRALVGKSERTLSRAEMAELQGWDISTVPDDVSPHPRPVKAVRGRGRMVNNAYVPENVEWQDVLCDGTVGRDPMSIPPETLTAAGHPPRRTAAVIGAMGDVHIEDGIVRCKDLRRQCLSCAESVGEVRRCFIYNCPIWPYRMGHNPHDPRRGVDPFEKASTRRKDPLHGSSGGEVDTGMSHLP